MTRVPARKRVFVGCEGGSERNYSAFLKRLSEDAVRQIHLETRDLGGGDPTQCLNIAIREFRKYRDVAGRKTPGFVILDTDRADAQRAEMQASAKLAELTIVWQDPCHEALLLRHFVGEERRQPPDCRVAMQLLSRHWPGYQKNTPAIRIADVLGIENVRRAAGVTPALQVLLTEIKL